MSQTASRVVAVLFLFASALAVESLHAADATNELTSPYFLDIIGGVDSSTFDVGPDTERISLSLDGEHLVFKKDSYQHIADGISVWSGRHVQKRAATYLYVAKNGDDSSLKLVKGDFEYDVMKDSSGYYELRVTDLTNTVAEEFLADSDHKVASAASQNSALTPSPHLQSLLHSGST